MVTKKTAIQTLRPGDAEAAVGYGYSSIMAQLIGALDQPVRNSDQFRMFYKQMIDEDETIGTGLEYLAGRVVSKIGDYQHKDPVIKELADKCIEKIRGTIKDMRKDVLVDAFAYGYGVAEFTVGNSNGQWLLSSMPVYDPLTVSFIMAKQSDNSINIGRIRQTVGGRETDIPVGKCLVKTYGGGGTPYGRPLLRRCYRWWAFKRALPKLWAVALERFGMPLLHGAASSEQTGKALDVALSNIHSKSHIVTDKDSVIQAIGTLGGGNVSAGFEAADALCDKKIYRAMFLPSLLGAGEGGGSYSLGEVHMELFNDTTIALAEEYIEAELEQLWRPIIEWNFGEQENYGSFGIRDATPASEKKTLSEMILNLANAGVVDPVSDVNWIRSTLGLPEVEEGAVLTKWELELKNKDDVSN